MSEQESRSTLRGITRIRLIGYRGTGKSAVAQSLALRLGWEWVDADVELELRAGKSIAAIFADDGEPAFRDLESKILAELAPRERIVLATGGGVVLQAENRKLLGDGAMVVWLRARPETIWQRVSNDWNSASRRPNLTTGGLVEIEELLRQRTPLYHECADLVIETDDKTVVEVTSNISEQLKRLTAP